MLLMEVLSPVEAASWCRHSQEPDTKLQVRVCPPSPASLGSFCPPYYAEGAQGRSGTFLGGRVHKEGRNGDDRSCARSISNIRY